MFKGPNKMTDYVFKVKLLLADLRYPAFYYRQSIHADKLKWCFEDLRKELMRRYDLRPILDVKTNFKLQWYYDGDMITVSNNDDLNIFMELKGTRLVVVRTQMDSRFFGIGTAPQFAINTRMQYKPNLRERFGLSTTDREILNNGIYSVPSSTSNQSVVVHHVGNNQPNETDDSTPIIDLVSPNSGICVEDDQSETTATQEAVSQTLPSIPNWRSAGVNVEDDQQKRTENVSLMGDFAQILDSVSVNAGLHAENDQSNPTVAVRTSSMEHNCAEAHAMITRQVMKLNRRSVPSPMSGRSEYSNSSVDSASTVDLVSPNSSIHVEDDQDEGATATQEAVSQTLPSIPNWRSAGVNVEDDQQKRTENVSLMGDSAQILDSVSVNAGLHAENDQSNPTVAVRTSSMEHNCAEAHAMIDREFMKLYMRSVASPMSGRSEYSNSSVDSASTVDLVSPNSSIHVEDDQDESTRATQETVPQTFPSILNWRTAGVNVQDDQQKRTGNVSFMGDDSAQILDTVSANAGLHAENDQPMYKMVGRKSFSNSLPSISVWRNTHQRDQPKFTEATTKTIPSRDDESVTKFAKRLSCAEAHKIIDRQLRNQMVRSDSNSMSNPKPKSSRITNSVSVNANEHTVAVSKIMEPLQDENNQPNASGDSAPIVDLVSVSSINVGDDHSESATATQKTVPQIFHSILDSRTADTGVHDENPPKDTEIIRKTILGRGNDSFVNPRALIKTVTFDLPTVQSDVQREATVTSSISSDRNTLSHQKVMANLESLLESRRQNFAIPPERPTPATEHPTETAELQKPTSELPKHPNLRVREALNTMTSVMKFSNSGGWLERLLEAVDGDIDEALKKLRPTYGFQTSDL